jgi:hypothetical protein
MGNGALYAAAELGSCSGGCFLSITAAFVEALNFSSDYFPCYDKSFAWRQVSLASSA